MMRPNEGKVATSATAVVQYIIRAADDSNLDESGMVDSERVDPESKLLPTDRPTIAQVSAEWTLNQQQHSSFVVLASAVLESILSYFEHDRTAPAAGELKAAGSCLGRYRVARDSEETLKLARQRVERILPPSDTLISRVQVRSRVVLHGKRPDWCEVVCCLLVLRAGSHVPDWLRRHRQVLRCASSAGLCAPMACTVDGVHQRYVGHGSGRVGWNDVSKRRWVSVQRASQPRRVHVFTMETNRARDRRRSQSDGSVGFVPTAQAARPTEATAAPQIRRRAHCLYGRLSSAPNRQRRVCGPRRGRLRQQSGRQLGLRTMARLPELWYRTHDPDEAGR
jgi:hypothetical protein